MSKGKITALVILALLVVLFLFNKGDVKVNLLLTERSFLKSLVFLTFTGVGVVIGILLK